MADEDLAGRVRAALAGAGAIREIKMFGGTGFMLNGNLVAGASKRGLLLRVGKEGQRDALARPGARAMEMRGRTMEGYIYVDPGALRGGELKPYLQMALTFVKTLPAKTAKPKSKVQKAKPKRQKRSRK